MRSTLKKSLYLGLAALSFASVAGVANNANAAKKSHHVKHAKTYATASYKNIPNQGNSNIAYTATGTNAIFNKPGTVKGAKQTVSKATMSDLASAKENFMVYQTAVTSRNSKYIKVVSFDKKYRGWIYAGKTDTTGYGSGVNQVNLATQAAPKYSSVYLSNPGQVALKSTPEGAQFNASSDNFSHTGFVSGDAFNVDAAQTVSKTGTTWYHLVDQKDNTINGWVPSNQVQLSSNNNYFDKDNQIKVNYTDNGNVVKSSNVNINPKDINTAFSNNILNSNGVVDAINEDATGISNATDAQNNDTDASKYQSGSSLYNSGYQFVNKLDNTNPAVQSVQAGDTVNVSVKSTEDNPALSKLNFNALNTNGIGSTTINTNDVYMPKVSNAQQEQLRGKFNQYINLNTFTANSNSGNLFYSEQGTSNYDKGLGILYSKPQVATSNMDNNIKQGDTYYNVYTFNPGTTMTANSEQTNGYSNTKTYGQPVNVYYNVQHVKGTADINGSNANDNSNYLG